MTNILSLVTAAYLAFGQPVPSTREVVRYGGIQAIHADGSLSLRFGAEERSEEGSRGGEAGHLVIRQRDVDYPFFATRHVIRYDDCDVVETWVEIRHEEEGPVRLVRMDSFAAELPDVPARVSVLSLAGASNRENRLCETDLAAGQALELSSREGIHNAWPSNPAMMISLGEATERTGDVLGAALAWSGCSSKRVRRTFDGRTSVFLGADSQDVPYVLDPGVTLVTPRAILVLSHKGRGEVSRQFHRWAHRHLMPHGDALHPVLLNSWEGSYFSFTEKTLTDMMDGVAEMGGEMFVLDDGWFGRGRYARNNSSSGLGDWAVNDRKLPHGLGWLADQAKARGLKFGLWVEPEMVNTNSALFAEHPDWMLREPKRRTLLGRGGTQNVLDLCNPAVRDRVFADLDAVCTGIPNLAYVKWDANAPISNLGSPYLPRDRQGNLGFDYATGLYDLLARFQAARPHVMTQACASGGGRMDFGFLRFADEFWASDRTDPVDRVFIQWGASQFYPASAMACHVTASPNHQTKRVTPLKYRFDVAMTGRLGFELHPKDLNSEEVAFAKRAVADYKAIRPIVQRGDLHRLASPHENDFAALMYVSEKKDGAVLFVLGLDKTASGPRRIVLDGLDPDRTYAFVERTQAANAAHLAAGLLPKAGRDLMTVGFDVSLSGPLDSVCIELTEQSEETAADPVCRQIETEVASAVDETVVRQARLVKSRPLTDYAALVRRTDEGEVWTEALEAALKENEVVVIPARAETYLIDRTVVLPSNRRIEAYGATVRLAADVQTVLLRNASVKDGTLAPVAPGGRDDNIAVCGGRWEDNSTCRRGYGRSGMFNLLPRRIGNFYGVSTLFCFDNADHVTVRDVTFARCGAFAVQSGGGRAHAYERIRFDDCFADGLHLNGNLSHVLVRDVRGKVGDDLVALNAYDWLNSSIDFGPQRFILCEDLELVLKNGKGYPAIRIQPAVFRYADGRQVDCAVSDVIFRRVRGIRTFKMYLQTPRYAIGTEPEWAAVGSGGNLYFEDIDIDLTQPMDLLAGYATSDPRRGHYGAFEFGANLSSVTFRDIRIRFHLDDYPLGHLATVGPKSAYYPAADGKPAIEIFDPYVSCTVGRVTVEGLKVEGRAPEELVREIAFDDINRDGRSTGRGRILSKEIRMKTPWKMFDRRLGMFVHWGIYSAGGLHEQEQMRYGRTREEYNRRTTEFTAANFSPDRFIDAAESAGAEYIVFTAKHHDGFCLWNTKTTDFNVMNAAARRDVLGELAAACRRRGMKLGFYFSNPDWHQPFARNDKSTHQIPLQPGDVPDRTKYMALVKAQVTELLTNYGEVVCFFWDIPTGIDLPEMDELVRRLQPGILINDRGWGNTKTCDYSTPERDYAWTLGNRHVEACDAVGVNSWGYRINEDYRTLGYLSRNIDRYLSTGGNYLLNVGPKADGTIPDEATQRMAAVGAWYAKVRESYRNVETVTNLADAAEMTVTRRGEDVYLHFRKPVLASGLFLPQIDRLPQEAVVLNTGTKLTAVVEMAPWAWNTPGAKPSLHLMGIPADDLANEAVVIRLRVCGDGPRTNTWNDVRSSAGACAGRWRRLRCGY